MRNYNNGSTEHKYTQEEIEEENIKWARFFYDLWIEEKSKEKKDGELNKYKP